VAGKLNGQPFEWIADADPRLGPVLEAIIDGKYYWVPFGNITRVTFEAPTDLRDVVWTPATFLWTNGGSAVGLIPTRYPGSESSTDDAIRLARKTDWHESPGGLLTGLGHRLLATDQTEMALLDIRSIELDHPVPAEGMPAAEA
jgi:type VI secretion system protein ImpE